MPPPPDRRAGDEDMNSNRRDGTDETDDLAQILTDSESDNGNSNSDVEDGDIRTTTHRCI